MVFSPTAMVKAKLFPLGGDVYISFYSKASRLHFGIPKELEPLATRSDQTIYGAGSEGKRRAIDSFKLNNPADYSRAYQILAKYLNADTLESKVEIVDINSIIKRHGLDRQENLEQLAKKFGVIHRIHHEFGADEKNIVLRSVADVCDYYEEGNHTIPKNIPEETRIEYVDELLNPTIIKRKGPLNIKTGTKSEIHPDFCILDLAVDFLSGCPAYSERSVNSKNQEVIKFKPWLGCDYCYARVNNKRHWGMGYASDDLKKVREIIREYVRIFAIDGKKPMALRYGERTETYMPELRDVFFTTMEGAFREGVLSVVSTKTLEYSEENARLLKEFNASVLISLDLDYLSPGISKLGFPNKVRFENAIKFHEQGVNIRLYPLTDMSMPLTNQKLIYAKKAYEASQKHGIPTQFLLVRPNSKRILEKITRTPIIETHPGERIIPGGKGYYKPKGKNYYYPVEIHPFFLDLIEKKDPLLGACAVVPPRTESLCSNCGIPGLEPKIEIQVEVPLKHEAEIRERKRQGYLEKQAKKKARSTRHQTKLDFGE